MKIAVVGLGKIGLPLAAQFAGKGHQVIGVDINAETVVDQSTRDQSRFPVRRTSPSTWLDWCPPGSLTATTDYAEADPDADAVVVVVPLFVDGDGRARLRLDGLRHQGHRQRT